MDPAMNFHYAILLDLKKHFLELQNPSAYGRVKRAHTYRRSMTCATSLDQLQ